ncbi:MAG: tryptophan synthase subunit alpha [Clostridia bacterium]|nr:tryptophan synthase subunit alpha [Clostridia bacterium]
MNRIDKKFEELNKKGKKALIPYICSGDPSVDMTEKLVYALEEAGADIIELGIPFSDPLADGPVIQDAAIRAFAGGYRLKDTFTVIENVRRKSDIPLVIMVYYSSIIGYGRERFAESCVKCGVDGLIIPDLPYEEYDEFEGCLEGTDIYMIPLVGLTSGERIPKLVKNAKGFVYCVSSMGVTGVRKEFDTRVESFVREVKKYTDTPACIGFGISSREDIEKFEEYADGCIVGSAIVRRIFESGCELEAVKEFVSGLR